MHLAFDDHVIQHVAAIVDGRVAREVDLAGVAVDLDLDDMCAVGKGHVLALPGMERVERRTSVSAERGDLEQADAAVGPRDYEASLLEADVGF